MYEMYPEWGPRPSSPDPTAQTVVQTAVQTALDLRDNGGPPPDDR